MNNHVIAENQFARVVHLKKFKQFVLPKAELKTKCPVGAQQAVPVQHDYENQTPDDRCRTNSTEEGTS